MAGLTKEQEKLLGVADDPKAAKILSDIWNMIDGEPLVAARMMRAFESARAVIRETVRELPAEWEKLDKEIARADLNRAAFLQDLQEFRTGVVGELSQVKDAMQTVEAFFSKVNVDQFVNKVNRVLDVCNRVAQAKEDGTLDILKKL
jgi:hypothetical protein